MAKTALITGFTGQDGSYLAELLLAKGYNLLAFVRPTPDSSSGWLGASQHLIQSVTQVSFPEHSVNDWIQLLANFKPDEIYHLAAQSSVIASWEKPIAANHANFDLTALLLDALRTASPHSKMFFACSSEVYGRPRTSPQDEQTPLHPITPYGVTKAAAHLLLECYRQRYGLFVCSGFLFNHESPRRQTNFFSRKITHTAARIKLGLTDKIELGDLAARRDWGFAGDYVDAMWRMLQLDAPHDFVIGTGHQSTTRKFVELAFQHLELDWQRHVTVNTDLVRPNDPRNIVANITKAQTLLDWYPKTSLTQLVQMMVEFDLECLAPSRAHRRAA